MPPLIPRSSTSLSTLSHASEGESLLKALLKSQWPVPLSGSKPYPVPMPLTTQVSHPKTLLTKSNESSHANLTKIYNPLTVSIKPQLQSLDSRGHNFDSYRVSQKKSVISV